MHIHLPDTPCSFISDPPLMSRTALQSGVSAITRFTSDPVRLLVEGADTGSKRYCWPPCWLL